MDASEPLSADVTPGFALWLTGLPASGKTSLAAALRLKLNALGIRSVLIDSDEMRRVLTPHPTYSTEERDWFYGALAQIAEWLTRSGVNVLIAATANRRAYRDAARRRIPRFAEIHVRCASSVCSKRDPKGLYALASAGEISALPGAGSEYEAPLNPEVIIATDAQTPEQSAEVLLNALASFLNLA